MNAERLKRMSWLDHLLRTQQRWQKCDVATRFSVGEKQIQRDICEMKRMGYKFNFSHRTNQFYGGMAPALLPTQFEPVPPELKRNCDEALEILRVIIDGPDSAMAEALERGRKLLAGQ